jgi:hypothetical protein
VSALVNWPISFITLKPSAGLALCAFALFVLAFRLFAMVNPPFQTRDINPSRAASIACGA